VIGETKPEDELRRTSVDVMPSPPRRPATTLTFDLWPSEFYQVIGRGQWIFPVSCIKIVQSVHEISWWQHLSGRTNVAEGQPKNIFPDTV